MLNLKYDGRIVKLIELLALEPNVIGIKLAFSQEILMSCSKRLLRFPRTLLHFQEISQIIVVQSFIGFM